MIPLGAIVPNLAINVVDQNSNPINAASVTLTITLPDGTTTVLTSSTTPPILNPQTGQYTCQYVTTEPGHHQVRWVTTNPTTVYDDVFNVTESSVGSMLSLAEAKLQLGMDPAYTKDDAELREWMRATTTAIQNYKHEVIVQTTFTEEHFFGSMWGPSWVIRSRMRLFHVPVIALLSIVQSDRSHTWDITQQDLDNDTGLVATVTGPPIRGRITVSYLAGYQIIPYNYLEGAKMLFQHMWETRRGPGGLQGIVGPEELADFRHYTSLPRKVTEMLGPPRPVVM